MSKSIIHEKGRGCYLCGARNVFLEEHHVFGGTGCRKLSEHWGLKVYLCNKCHTGSDKAVHFNKEIREDLQSHVQKIAMEYYGWTKEDFIKIFGRNYCDD